MEIINKKIGVLKPYDKNPRKNEQAVKYVASSIKEFGFKVPIVIDNNNIIVSGHTRLLAAKELGLKEVPCILANDLTDEQIKAFRLVDNKTSEMSGWDFPMLEDELAGIGFDMAEFGFIDHGEIDLDGLFVEHEPKEKEPHMVTCPHCGETFEE